MANTKNFVIEWIDPKELVPYEKNAKVHSQEQVDGLAKMIHRFGFDQPIVIDDEKTIIKGHARRLAALLLGLDSVPVIRSTHTEYEAIAHRIGDNKISEAPWDPNLLKFDFGTLQRADFETEYTAFSDAKVAEFITPETSEEKFGEDAHKNIHERKEDYESSEVRQIILVTDPESFETLMRKFADAQEVLGVETNIEVVEKLFEIYEENNHRTEE